jgi:thiol-disulfide isomerase/thioredoxin
MRQLSAIIAFVIGLSTSLSAQDFNVKIEGVIIGYDGQSEVNYTFSSLNCGMPYDGVFKMKPDESGYFRIFKWVDDVRYFHFYYQNKQADSIEHSASLLVQPNKSYSIISEGRCTKDVKEMDGPYSKDKSYVIKPYSPEIFSLNNNETDKGIALHMDIGQMCYNLIDNGTIGSLFREDWDLLNPNSLMSTLNNRIDNQVKKFRELLESGHIDEEFFHIAILNVEYTQAYRLAQTIQDTWIKPRNFGIEDSDIAEKLRQIYIHIFEKYPVEGVEIEKVQAFPKYIFLYLDYLSYQENYILTGEWYSRGMPYMTIDNIKSKLTEKVYRQLKIMNTFSSVASLQLSSDQKAKQFLKDNPEIEKSVYGDLLINSLIPRAELFDSLSNRTLGEKVVFIDRQESIESVGQILEYFEGKPLLIDFWGTWCGPCRYQFKYNEILKPFLKKHGIEILYASKEYNTIRSDWKKVIAAYDLEGYHFLLNNHFEKSLQDNNIVIAGLPSYVFVDSKGKFFKLEDTFPSDGENFYKQIEEIIK